MSQTSRPPARVVVSWSTGKDAAWCLHTLRNRHEVEVIGLLTSVTSTFERVSVHGTRLEILHAQAAGLGLPVWPIEIPYPCSNDQYDAAMGDAVAGLHEAWAPTHVAFGDLFLEDVRAYRENRMAETPLTPLFPLWGRSTEELSTEMVKSGLEAIIVSAPADSEAAPLVGLPWSKETLAALPSTVDPCGENGEFHTCVVAGLGLPALSVRKGETVHRDDGVYCDLLLDPS